MQPPNHHQRLAALRDIIADIERKPALAEAREGIGHDDLRGAFPTLPAGLMQEVYSEYPGDGGSSLGFALAQLKVLMTVRRPSVFYLQLAGDAQKFGMPYGPGIGWFGLNPESLVIVRVADMTEFLWATEEMISCSAVAGVVADVRGEPKLLNFTASRRLSLRASANGVSLFLLRYGPHRENSASHLRWRLSPHRSGRHPFDDRALGAVRWQLQLEKGRIAGNQADWVLEWTKNGFAVVAEPERSNFHRLGTAVPGAVFTPLGDRLSQAS